MDKRDMPFVPVDGVEGIWKPNPEYANETELVPFVKYPCRVLRPINGNAEYMNSDDVVVSLVPSGQMYLEDYSGVFHTDAVLDVDFEII